MNLRRHLHLNVDLRDADTGDVWTPAAAVSEITTIPTTETTTTNVLAPDGTGGVEWRADAMHTEITDIPTTDTDTAKVLAPDGAGGVGWVAPAAGFVDPMTTAGDMVYQSNAINYATVADGASAASVGSGNINPTSYMIDENDSTYHGTFNFGDATVIIDLGAARTIGTWRAVFIAPSGSFKWQYSTNGTDYTDATEYITNAGGSPSVNVGSFNPLIEARYWKFVPSDPTGLSHSYYTFELKGVEEPASLPIGSSGEVLTVASGVPAWAAPALPSEITDIATAITDDTLVLAPDGAGGVAFRAEVGFADPTTATGDTIYRGAVGSDLNLSATLSAGPGGGDHAFTDEANANDANDTTYAQGDYVAGSSLISDFGAAADVTAFRALSTYPQNFRIESSDNGTDWTSRYTQSSHVDDTGIVALSAGTTSARYWQIIGTDQGSSYWRIKTWALYAPGSPVALPVGSDGNVLTVASGAPAWAAPKTVATDAIWDAAGDLAVGTGADTAGRLAKGNAGGVLAMGNSAVIWNANTSFPASKATGDRYFRTDLGMEFYWDGTRWVTTTLFSDSMSRIAVNPVVDTDGSATLYYGVPGGTDIYVVDFIFAAFVLTTNDGSNYWTVALEKSPPTGASTSIGSATTAADTASNWTNHTASVNAVVVVASYPQLQVVATDTGSPGNLYMGARYTFRIIAT